MGVGWSTVGAVRSDAESVPSLTILDVDRTLDRLATTAGQGSQRTRQDLLSDLLARATAVEADFVRHLLLGDLRQGALEGVLTDAVAVAVGVPLALVRRAAMLRGDLRETAAIAIAKAEGLEGLERVRLSVLRPIQPTLASTAVGVEAAVTGRADGVIAPVAVEWKLDGARLQVHRDGDAVRIFSRNLNDLTGRLPGVVDLVRHLPVSKVVLDAEVLTVRNNRPVPFQETMSRVGRGASQGDDATDGESDRDDGLRPFFFDILHLDGEDLLDEPWHRRSVALDHALGSSGDRRRLPSLVTADTG